MSEWFAAWLPFVTTLMVLILPGAGVGLAAGLRAMSLFSLAPVISLGVISVSAVVAPYAGLDWGPLPVVVGVLATSVILWTWRTLAAGRMGCRRAEVGRLSYMPTIAALGGLAVGGGVLMYRLARIFESPSFVSQTADNVFHLNAVRYIVDTGSASSMDLGATSGGGPAFYPGAWHGLAALIVQLSGSSIPVAVACLNLAIGCVMWPLSMWFLCRTLFGSSVAMNMAFAVLIGSFSAFPYLLIDWGVIYPNYLGIAALPAVFGIGLMLFRNGVAASRQGAVLPLLGLIGLAGITLSHPNTLLTLLVLSVPYLITRLMHRAVRARLRLPWGRPAGLPVLVTIFLTVTFAVAWLVLRPFPYTSFTITWPPYQSTAQAIGEVLSTTHSARQAAWATGGLFVVGLYVAWTHRTYRWMVWCAGVWAFLMVVVTAWQPSLSRAFLTGGWYDDYKRIAAGLVLITLPLSVLGFIGLYRFVARVLGSLLKNTRRVPAVAAMALIAVPTAVITHTGPIRDAAIAANSNYSLRPGSPIMSPDELLLYQKLPALVPEDSVIAGNPWDGSAWAYFVSGRRVLFPHVIPSMNEDKDLIARSFREALSNPQVCAAAKSLDVEYAITSDELIYLPGNSNNTKYPGLERLNEAPGFKEIARVGANRLYKLDGCS
ncbi:hypothetical protein HC744_02455 [Arthrobacter sp. S1_S22]|nr:hypothetical protein [Arthrobacter sp. S1_S22]